MAAFGALAVNAMTSHRQGSMKVIKVLAVKAYGLLPTPAKVFDPGGITQDDTFFAFMGFQKDFNFFVVTRGIKNL